MSSSQPPAQPPEPLAFPRFLFRALLVPAATFGLNWVLASMGLTFLAVPLLGIGIIVGVPAFFVAGFLLIRDWPRRNSPINLVLVAVAALPVLVVVIIAVIWIFGLHFHI